MRNYRLLAYTLRKCVKAKDTGLKQVRNTTDESFLGDWSKLVNRRYLLYLDSQPKSKTAQLTLLVGGINKQLDESCYLISNKLICCCGLILPRSGSMWPRSKHIINGTMSQRMKTANDSAKQMQAKSRLGVANREHSNSHFHAWTSRCRMRQKEKNTNTRINKGLFDQLAQVTSRRPNAHLILITVVSMRHSRQQSHATPIQHCWLKCVTGNVKFVITRARFNPTDSSRIRNVRITSKLEQMQAIIHQFHARWSTLN